MGSESADAAKAPGTATASAAGARLPAGPEADAWAASTAIGASTATKEIAKAQRGFLHDCERNARYHNRRRAFFERWHRWAMFLVILAGSSAAATVGDLSTVAAVLTAVIGAGDLAFAPAERAREHAALARRYILLQAQNQIATDQAALLQFGAALQEIHADESPTYYALDALCYNEVVRAWGDAEEFYLSVSWCQRLFANLWPFAPTKFPRRRSADL